MKTLLIAIFVVIALFSTISFTSQSFAQETRMFTDGGYLYVDELKEIVGRKKLSEWKKQDSVSVQEIQSYLQLRQLYLMPNYNPDDVEEFLIQKFGQRVYLIFNLGNYIMYKSHDEYGHYRWERQELKSISSDMLDRLVIACKSNQD